jgi:hypothetical protein
MKKISTARQPYLPTNVGAFVQDLLDKADPLLIVKCFKPLIEASGIELTLLTARMRPEIHRSQSETVALASQEALNRSDEVESGLSRVHFGTWTPAPSDKSHQLWTPLSTLHYNLHLVIYLFRRYRCLPA